MGVSTCMLILGLKTCFCYFYFCFLFYPANDSPSKTMKMLFISSRKLFLFLRYSNFCISVLHSFSTSRPLLWRMIEDKSKVHDVINCVNEISITHFVWYLENEKKYDIETLSIDWVSDKEHFYRKIMQKICSKSWSQTPL